MPTLSEYNPDWPIGDLDEVVVAVQKCIAKEQLGLTVRPKLGDKHTEALVPLTVPASLQEKILLAIMRRKDITLREVGDLPILEVSSPVPPGWQPASSTKSFERQGSRAVTYFQQFSAAPGRTTVFWLRHLIIDLLRLSA